MDGEIKYGNGRVFLRGGGIFRFFIYSVTQKLPHILYCNFCVSIFERLCDLQYIFVITSGSPSWY